MTENPHLTDEQRAAIDELTRGAHPARIFAMIDAATGEPWSARAAVLDWDALERDLGSAIESTGGGAPYGVTSVLMWHLPALIAELGRK